MPTLNEIVGGNTGQTRTVFTTNNIAIEPLNGPTSVEEVMDRFPEETYQQGRDTHLFRLLSALCGDAGAGLAKKQAYAARLRYEAEFVEFDILDDVYVSQFQFQRLASETYPFNANADALTPTQWNDVELANQSYSHRMAAWWAAVRHGNSKEGIRLAAEAGSGLDCDVSEQYRFIFDQFSDMPLDIKPDGITPSPEEVVVLPRFVPGGDVSYSTGYEKQWEFTPPTLNGGVGRPVPSPGILAPALVWIPPPQAKVALVGASAVKANTIAIPAHLAGDLIVITAMQFGQEPAAPAAGGTVPTWVTQASGYTNKLAVLTVTAVATSGSHTSGTFARTGFLNVAVYRPTDGTLSVGAVGTYVSGSDPSTPFLTYPGITLQRDDGTSAIYRLAAVRETGNCQIDQPPPGYALLAQYGVRPGPPDVPPEVSAAFAAHTRQAVTSVAPDTVRTTSTNGPGSQIAWTIEIKITPGPGVYVESRNARLARYALEATQYIAKEPFDRLLPEIERNTVEMLDRLKPTTSAVTFMPQTIREIPIPISAPPSASSERMNVTRFVTGNAAVPWPAVDVERNLFMVGGEETEPGHYYGMNRDLPIIFLTPESVRAYRGEAETAETYGTNEFFTQTAGVAPYEHYRSVHQGPFFPVLGAIFPFIFNVLPSATFEPEQAVASQNTPLIFEGQFLG